MANPKLHRKGAPAGWVNAREIASATGFRIQAVLQMLSSNDDEKREPDHMEQGDGQGVG